MHFLTGRALDRLKNGATVIFEIQLSLAVDSKSNALRRSIERFAVSYDLWEERFAVIGLRQGSKAVSHLSAQAAEVWCLDQLAVPTSGIAPERPVWLRLEIRAEESNERIDGDSDASVDLARLVEFQPGRPAARDALVGRTRSGAARQHSFPRRRGEVPMNRLRNQLIFVFLAATLIPLGATLWLAASLLDHSLRYATTAELDEVSRLLGEAGREIYQRARESLKQQADSGQLRAERYEPANLAAWPLPVREFRESEAEERFLLSGPQGDRLNYFVRRGDEIHVYSQRLGGIGMSRLTEQYRKARSLVETAQDRNLRRGFLTTFILLAAAVWLVALTVLIYVANRICRPIHQLTEALSKLARGDLETRVGASRNDEIGGAIRAFNHMADQMQQSRSRLIYLTRMASWQALARKMAHEVKNSLTPIRLNMEEIVARRSSQDPFIEQAAQIVADEVNTLERRVRAFSEFAAEPPVRPGPVDVASIAEERIAFLRAAHSEVCYRTARAGEPLTALADEDLLRGILTNLIENAAQAAGPGGSVLVKTVLSEGRVCVEVHDSGPGLSALARETLFEPTISFKKAGMGLGLSIARKSALLCGGDIVLIRGELGGAGFRVILPKAAIPEGVYATR